MLKKRVFAGALSLVMAVAGCTPALAGEWKKSGEEWTYLNDDGSLFTGWLSDGGKWYYMTDDGYMVTGGWIPKENTWHYLTSDGSMAVSTTIENYHFDADGALITNAPIVENPGDGGHNYYKGLTAEQAEEADRHAQVLAIMVMNNPENDTDLKKVQAAIGYIRQYSFHEPYGQLGELDYRSPYGVFVTQCYACSGLTRALGRILDYCGFTWTHAHENEDRHQWLILNMDGQQGYADAQIQSAGYGRLME